MTVNFEQAALSYVGFGWRVFPLAQGLKIPAIKGGHGVKEASSYPDDIISWARKYPNANIGLACGVPSGVVVVDIDPRNGGFETLAKHASRGHILPPGPRARTGNGGLHHFFRYQPGVTNSKGRFGPGVDIKSTGGYVVAAPSRIAKSKDGPGGEYFWEVSPFDVDVPRLPIWVATLLNPPKKQGVSTFDSQTRFDGGSIGGLGRFVAKSAKGERNNVCYWSACRAAEAVAKHQASRGEAERELLRNAMSAGLPEAEARATIKSAFEKVLNGK